MRRLIAAAMALVILVLILAALTIPLWRGEDPYQRDLRAYADCIADPNLPLRATTSAGYVVHFDEDVALAHIGVQISKGNLTIEEIRNALDTTCKGE